MHEELDVCFPNVFRTRRMFLECNPNTSRIHLQATFGRSINIILSMRNTFLELPNAVLYASVRNRTASMLRPRIHRILPEYGPFVPRTYFIFGKHSEWHSAQCKRAISLFVCMWYVFCYGDPTVTTTTIDNENSGPSRVVSPCERHQSN
jgi:hypothetical protein